MDRRVQSCVSGRTRGSREGASKTVGIRQAGGCRTRLGKTRLEALRGREALSPVGRSVDKNPLPISPSRPRFALDTLCQVGSVLPFEDRFFSYVLHTLPQEDQKHAYGQAARQEGRAAPTVNCHRFRATGITNYLSNGGALEDARAIAAHESSQTTRLYDRSGDKVTLDETERIRF